MGSESSRRSSVSMVRLVRSPKRSMEVRKLTPEEANKYYSTYLTSPLFADPQLRSILSFYTWDLFKYKYYKIPTQTIWDLHKAYKHMQNKEKIIPILKIMRYFHESKIVPFILLHAVETYTPEYSYLAARAVLKYPTDPVQLLKFYRSRFREFPGKGVNEAVIDFFNSLKPYEIAAATRFKVEDKDMEHWINKNWRIPVNQEVPRVLLMGFETKRERRIAELFYLGRHYDAFRELHELALDRLGVPEDIVSIVEQFTWSYKATPPLNLTLQELFKFYWAFRKVLGRAIAVVKENKPADVNSIVRLVSLLEQIIDKTVDEFYKTTPAVEGEVLVANTENVGAPIYVGVGRAGYVDEVFASIATIISKGEYPVYSVNKRIKVWYPEGAAKKSASERFKSIIRFLMEARSGVRVTAKNRVFPDAGRVVVLGATLRDIAWSVRRLVGLESLVVDEYMISLSPKMFVPEWGIYSGFSNRVTNYISAPWTYFE